MKFELTQERQMLQDGLRRFLRETCTPQALAQIAEGDTGHSQEVWDGLAEMGVIGAMFAEEHGGFGGGGFDISVIFEELGRAGAVEPLLETGVMAGGLVATLGDDAQRALLDDVIGGSVQLAFAHGEPGSRYDLERVETTAKADSDGYVLNGRKSVVVNGANADHLVISARTGGEPSDRDGISLFRVERDAEGLGFRDYPITAGGRAAEISLSDVTVGKDALLGPKGGAFEAIELASARATAALSAEALGMMETIRALTTEYLKGRKQFGQPIGKFQALQHRMADVLIEIEQARSAVINLAGHLDEPRDVRELHVSATKTLVGQVARLVVEESIQMHGGIGMTEEYELAHLARRLTMVDHRLGDTTYHLGRFIRLSAA